MFNDVEQDKYSAIIGNVLNHAIRIKWHVHTNAYLMHIGQNWFELIRIRSIHTLVTESKFSDGIRKLFCTSVW